MGTVSDYIVLGKESMFNKKDERRKLHNHSLPWPYEAHRMKVGHYHCKQHSLQKSGPLPDLCSSASVSH